MRGLLIGTLAVLAMSQNLRAAPSSTPPQDQPIQEAPAQDQASPQVDLRKPEVRQGPYIGVSSMGVAVLAHDDGDPLAPWYGFGFALGLGEMFTDDFGLGLDVSFAQVESGRFSEGMVVGLQLVGQWRVLPRVATHIAAGVGGVSGQDKREDGDTAGMGGGYYGAGVTYDFYPYPSGLSGGLALSPKAQVKFVPGDSFGAVTFWLGLEATWWFGLDKNQLDLEVDEAF